MNTRKTAAKKTRRMEPVTEPASRLVDAVGSRRVVLCLGSGGVGKTTTSAALAIGLARRGERVVVMTIDPARRLADTLGLTGALGNEPSLVKPPSRGRNRWTGELWAAMLDPAATFETVIRSEATSPEQAERIMANPLFVNLTNSLSGTNEYMAAEQLHRLHGDDRFDRVIIDTPPSRHVMDFLDSPGRMTRFIDHRLYRSVFAPKHGVLRTINAGTQVVLRLLGRLVGSRLVDDVIDFFADFEGLDEGFRRRAVDIEALLTGDDAAYVLITAPRDEPLREADWILDNLDRRGRSIDALIVNRVLPVDVPDDDSGSDRPGNGADGGVGQPADDEDLSPLVRNHRELVALARQEERLIGRLDDRLSTDPDHEVATIRLHEQLRPVKDLTDLAALSDQL